MDHVILPTIDDISSKQSFNLKCTLSLLKRQFEVLLSIENDESISDDERIKEISLIVRAHSGIIFDGLRIKSGYSSIGANKSTNKVKEVLAEHFYPRLDSGKMLFDMWKNGASNKELLEQLLLCSMTHDVLKSEHGAISDKQTEMKNAGWRKQYTAAGIILEESINLKSVDYHCDGEVFPSKKVAAEAFQVSITDIERRCGAPRSKSGKGKWDNWYTVKKIQKVA